RAAIADALTPLEQPSTADGAADPSTQPETPAAPVLPPPSDTASAGSRARTVALNQPTAPPARARAITAAPTDAPPARPPAPKDTAAATAPVDPNTPRRVVVKPLGGIED